jgi:GT2 family glycosyltransferase
MLPANVSAIMPTFGRSDRISKTLSEILQCTPPPGEVIVHVDGGDSQTIELLRTKFPGIQILKSSQHLGPGGGRNLMLAAAKHEIVASFDDDSYPIDRDYFARLVELFEHHPQAAVITAEVFTMGQEVGASSNQLRWVADFIGCGCAYRRSRFLETHGYVPLVVAYGMEEADIAIQLHALGHRVIKASCLRVFHDTDYSGHVSSKLVSGTIANAALLVYLRYPLNAWPRGTLQIANAVFYAIRHGRWRGVISGLLRIPSHLLTHRHHRRVVSTKALRSYLALRLNPRPIRSNG